MRKFLSNLLPKLTIITVNLNNVLGLRKTIESIINQNFTDFEYLVIDGGSTDGSVDIIKENAKKITYWVSEPDKGIYNAMNKGILQAKGEYLLFLNSGDWLFDEGILLKVFANNQHADILYGDCMMWHHENRIKLHTFKNKEINLQFLFKHSLAHPASFIKSKLFVNDLYDENFKIVSDWKFFLKKIVQESCSIYYLSSTIAFFDMSGISSNNGMQSAVLQERNAVLINVFSPMTLSNIQDLYNLNNWEPFQDILEIQKLNGFNTFAFKLLHIIVKLHRRFQLLTGLKN